MRDRLLDGICSFIAKWLPHRVIPRPDGAPYLVRYYFFGGPRKESTRPFNLYLHLFLSSDEEDLAHSHPWTRSISLILTGGYREQRRIGDLLISREVKPFSLNFIDADDYHRVDLLKDRAWTLFLAGSPDKTWFFWDPKTKETIHWREQIFVRRPRKEVVEA